MKLGDIAKTIGGKLVGDPEIEVKGISSPQRPKAGTLVFCPTREDIELALSGSPLGIVTSVGSDFEPRIEVEDVKLALALFLESFYPEKHPEGVSPKAHVSKDVSIGRGVYIAPFVVIEEGVVLEDGVKVYPFTFIGAHSVVGKDSVIFSGVQIYPKTVIGKRVRIHSGAVIGSDGFGYHIGKEGIKKLNHIGNVVIEDDVEIGANTTIDRAMIDSTRIGESTKIDNLVMIAHNCDIGEGNVILGQAAFAGSVKTGRNVIIAGQAGISDHVKIGDNVTVVGRSGVVKDLEGGKVYGAGLAAVEWKQWKRIYTYIMKLPEIAKKLR